MSKITPVLMSGGTGSRLWPLSREALPKQLLPLLSSESLLQQTVHRVTQPDLFNAPLVIANAAHRFLIAEQLREIGVTGARIVLEPKGRNTAPVAAVAALLCARRDPDDIMLLMPADHSIPDLEAFQTVIEDGLEAARAGYFVLFGIHPTHPATGYGYIRSGEPLDGKPGSYRVADFAEKPDRAVAETYLASGQYAWNSGIFLLPAGRLMEELKHFEPELLQACGEAVELAVEDLDFLRLDARSFSRARAISIDHAVMERTTKAAVVPVSFPWSDIGAWSALQEAGSKDENGTVSIGQTLSLDTYGSYVRSEGPLVATIGVKDLIIVATPDAILVAAKDRDQDVKLIVDRLKASGHASATETQQVHRPWGHFRSLHAGDRFQVKCITVDPGQKLSLQKHFHRSEHWVVVNGTALVTRDDEQFLLRENESVYLPLGCVHRLENPGRLPLNLIEVQSGSYLGEDDIVRLEDTYARE